MIRIFAVYKFRRCYGILSKEPNPYAGSRPSDIIGLYVKQCAIESGQHAPPQLLYMKRFAVGSENIDPVPVIHFPHWMKKNECLCKLADTAKKEITCAAMPIIPRHVAK